ncbi:hypothetical protein IHE45_01G054600 [Dioscorea alata]|uniref:Uncharacterized protein n=1 Tax=Dioscorea alata TaxID=55571 RepID=A0ACB7WUJ6_DIOAL|nr:hypothetical protein IHE45_01G054600 [Dioscorea alata]
MPCWTNHLVSLILFSQIKPSQLSTSFRCSSSSHLGFAAGAEKDAVHHIEGRVHSISHENINE